MTFLRCAGSGAVLPTRIFVDGECSAARAPAVCANGCGYRPVTKTISAAAALPAGGCFWLIPPAARRSWGVEGASPRRHDAPYIGELVSGLRNSQHPNMREKDGLKPVGCMSLPAIHRSWRPERPSARATYRLVVLGFGGSPIVWICRCH